MVTLALAGDTMLGRAVALRLATEPFESVVAPAVRELTVSADACVLNLECCVSDRGTPWPAPGKPFFFRAPPRAAEALAWLGVDCVTLANNHALDFGPRALQDTRTHLHDVGIATVGAGPNAEQARDGHTITIGDLRLGVLGVTDDPPDFGAGPDNPGVAFADLYHDVPAWLRERVTAMTRVVDTVLVTPHWGPNMTSSPTQHVRRAARVLIDAGAGLIAGHSAHVFHGVAGPVLYDLGDFVDDYAVDPRLRNDLGLLFLVDIDARGPASLTAVPLALDFCHTRLARPDEAAWLRTRFAAACAALGTEARMSADGNVEVSLR
jgi:poly-gamma-glutamate synthesis protein (capsule biosynthesis protein)